METEPFNSTKIVKADINLFLKHQEEILQIEREQVENSSSEHLFDEEDELNFMTDALNKGGSAYLAMENDKVIGFLVVGPLDDGSDLPKSVTQNFPVQKCLHIKVMYIKEPGKGVGSYLLENLVEEADKEKWEYLFVRTWIAPPNEGAINFYTKKSGFEIIPNAIVESTKTKTDQSGTFQIKRQYFAKKI